MMFSGADFVQNIKSKMRLRASKFIIARKSVTIYTRNCDRSRPNIVVTIQNGGFLYSRIDFLHLPWLELFLL